MQSIRQVLEGMGNEDDIKTIIEIYGFLPFPLRPTSEHIFELFAAEYDNLYPDGYATASELKIVAKSIIIAERLEEDRLP